MRDLSVLLAQTCAELLLQSLGNPLYMRSNLDIG